MNSILKQIKNEHRSNLLLWAELLLVFVVLWYIVDVIYVTARVYLMPLGFDIENTYLLTMERLTPKSAAFQPNQTVEDDMNNLTVIVDRLTQRPDVEAACISQNSLPYNDGSNGITFGIDTVRINCLRRWITPDYFRVFRYQNADGSGSESLAKALPGSLVASVDVADNYPEVSARGLGLRGKMAWVWDNREDVPKIPITALSMPVRYDNFWPADGWRGTYLANELTKEGLIRLGSVKYIQVNVRAREGEDIGFADRLMDDADRLYQVGNVYIQGIIPMSSMRDSYQIDNVNELRTQFCILFFLLLNIFLGIIGTFWFRTQHRRSEVALRMALGSTKQGIFGRLIGEGLLLLVLAAVPALLITFNLGYAELVEVSRLPFDAVRYIVGVLLTLLLMALMIVSGIWFPARQAMKVQPAEALHEE